MLVNRTITLYVPVHEQEPQLRGARGQFGQVGRTGKIWGNEQCILIKLICWKYGECEQQKEGGDKLSSVLKACTRPISALPPLLCTCPQGFYFLRPYSYDAEMTTYRANIYTWISFCLSSFIYVILIPKIMHSLLEKQEEKPLNYA